MEKRDTPRTRGDVVWDVVRFVWLLTKLLIPLFSLLHMAYDVLRAIQAFGRSMGLTALRATWISLLAVAGIGFLKVAGGPVQAGLVFVVTMLLGGALLARNDLQALWTDVHGTEQDIATTVIDIDERRRRWASRHRQTTTRAE